MLSIRITRNPGGPSVAVARGATIPWVVRGTFRADGDPQPRVTVTALGIDYAAVVDVAARRWQAMVQLTGPSRVSLLATLHAQERDATGQLHARDVPSWRMLLVARDPQDDPLYSLNGTVVDTRGAPLIGVQVTAFDLDRRSRADTLGLSTTDDGGGVSFVFRESDFSETAGEGGPDLRFVVRQGTRVLAATLVDRRGNWIPNAPVDLPPFTLRVTGLNGALLSPPVRTKWQGTGGSRGFLGLPSGDELPLARGARGAHFAGGSILWSPEFGAKLVYGLIRARWQALGAEVGALGLPVSDEIDDPAVVGARASVFERGVIRWRPGQAQAVASGHDYLRLHGAVRAQILARFFAVGRGGRRNHFSTLNRLAAEVPAVGGTVTLADADRARWRITMNSGENPFLYGTGLVATLAVEELAGNEESRKALTDWLATTRSLCRWTHIGPAGEGRLPQRWDAGTETEGFAPTEHFIPQGQGWSWSLPASDIHHFASRPPETLQPLLGPRAAARYFEEAANGLGNPYRRWELSMDELTGLVTSYWLIAKLTSTAALQSEVSRQATWVGNYLADHGYLLIRPQGGFAWQGYAESLPAMEHPISRALETAAGGTTRFASRANLQQALQLSGHWDQLAGPITGWQALSIVLTAATLPTSVVALSIGLTASAATLAFSGQVLTPDMLGAAAALYLHRDVVDVLLSTPGSRNNAGLAIAALFMGAGNKALLYRNLTTAMALVGNKESWAVNFPGTLCLTGLDDSDSTVRDTFNAWFTARQGRPDLETKGIGSRTLWAEAVRTLLAGNDAAIEAGLVRKLDRAVVELFRDCYFDPRLPTSILDVDHPAGGQEPHEYALFPWYRYGSHPDTPYGPLDFLGAHALACWHARRRAMAGTPVTTPGFPAALNATAMAGWPEAAVPAHCLQALNQAGIPLEALQGASPPPLLRQGAYPVYSQPVPRAQPRPTPWPRANTLLCDVAVVVDASIPGELATGVTLHPGFEFSIEANGSLWAGRVLDPAHGPEGLPRVVHDARWPLHSGLDPSANAFCLLGRLNGWFRIGDRLSRRPWRLPYPRALFLRINDGERVAGTGAWTARIRVWGPAGSQPDPPVQRAPHPLNHGAVLRTTNPFDLIEVTIEPGAVPADRVLFELAVAPTLTARKELRVDGLAVPVSMATEGSLRSVTAEVRGTDLPTCTLALSRRVVLGMVQVRLVGQLDVIPGGAKVRLEWVFD